MILLDTHVWLWLSDDQPALGKPARHAIEAALKEDTLYLSPISLWEVALKSSRGKLVLDRPLRPWMLKTLELTRVRLFPISASIACDCAELPPEFHGDPADRIIAATARCEGLTLITHDKALLQLAKHGFFKAIAT